MDKSVRYRVNVSTSVKGIKTYDCTVEIEYKEEEDTLDFRGAQQEEETLLRSDALVAALDQRYPAPVEEKK